MTRPYVRSGTVTAHRATEERYVALRRDGVGPFQAALRLKLTISGGETFERHYRAQTVMATDSSCPKFARHDAHVSALRAIGGFPSLLVITVKGRRVPILVAQDGRLWRAGR